MGSNFCKYSLSKIVASGSKDDLHTKYFGPTMPKLDKTNQEATYYPSTPQNKALYLLFDKATNVWGTINAAYKNANAKVPQTQGTEDFLFTIKKDTYASFADGSNVAWFVRVDHDDKALIARIHVPSAYAGKEAIGYVFFGRIASGTVSDTTTRGFTKNLFTKVYSSNTALNLGFMTSGKFPKNCIQGNIFSRIDNTKKHQYIGPLFADSNKISNVLQKTNGQEAYKYEPLTNPATPNVLNTAQIINGPSNLRDTVKTLDYTDSSQADGIMSAAESTFIDTSNAVEMMSGFATNYGDLNGQAQIESYNSAIDYISETGNLNITSLQHGIIGMPYQFLPTTDCRISGTSYKGYYNGSVLCDLSPDTLGTAGYEFAEKIISRMPLLYITPCNTSFLNNPSDDEKTTLLSAFEFEDDTELGDFLSEYSGKLYTTTQACYEYFNYVNAMTRTGAVNLEIGDYKLEDDGYSSATRLDSFSWYKYQGATEEYAVVETNTTDTVEERDMTDAVEHAEEEAAEEDESIVNWIDNTLDQSLDALGSTRSAEFTNKINDLVYMRAVIPFYVNSESSFQETMTNETSESSLASTVNGLSDKAREMQFLMGTAKSALASSLNRLDTDTDISQLKTNIDTIISNLGKTNSIFGTLANSVKTIVSGGRLIFPQIWSGSTFSKNYNITIKLTTPNYDVLSWYLNIYVPLCHLIALVLPRSEYVNSYTTPFILRAFYKGMFNIDMGIITDMNITKGKEGGWTKDQLPTVVEVSFTITDLYSELGMTSFGNMCKGHTLQNVQELDYLANMCGINLQSPDNARMISYYRIYKEGSIKDLVPSLKNSIVDSLSNKWSSIYSNFWM